MQQILAPPELIQDNEDSHILETFLISTKPNEAKWCISKETGHDKVKTFLGKHFIIIPELIQKPLEQGGGGHYFGTDSKDDLLKGYRNHSHGLISRVKGPFSYNDGTDDYFYKANIKLSGSKAANALIENGSNTWIPFAVSPHIWPLKGTDDNVEDWEGIGLALVIKGAYGQDAVVTKYCKGSNMVCERSLASSILCDKEDSSLAAMISSLVNQTDNKGIMSTVTQVNPNDFNKQQVQPQVPEVKVNETKQDNITLTKEEYDSLNKKLDESKVLEAKVTSLENEYKTNVLNSMLVDVEDESVKKTLFDKYFASDVKQLNEFYNDINAHVIPNKVKKATEEATAEAKKNLIEENKTKSKAGSSIQLKPEPKQETESKAASVPQVNTVSQLRRELGL